MGIAEDPATGAASGPLGCYLVKYGLVKQTRQVALVSEQGFEIGRLSVIHIEVEQENERITAVTIGGQCVYMGEAYLQLSETHV